MTPNLTIGRISIDMLRSSEAGEVKLPWLSAHRLTHDELPGELFLFNPSVDPTANGDRLVRVSPLSPCALNLSTNTQMLRMISNPQYKYLAHTLWISSRGTIRRLIPHSEDARLISVDRGPHEGKWASFSRAYAPPFAKLQPHRGSGWKLINSTMFLLGLSRPGQEIPLMYKGQTLREKNWAPLVHEGKLFFLYSVCPFVMLDCSFTTGACFEAQRAAGGPWCSQRDAKGRMWSIRGSSQFIPLRDPETKATEYVGVVHRSRFMRYSHAFMRLTAPPFRARALVGWFTFPFAKPAADRHGPRTEHEAMRQMCLGFAARPDTERAVLSYGVGDCYAAEAEVFAADIFRADDFRK